MEKRIGLQFIEDFFDGPIQFELSIAGENSELKHSNCAECHRF